MKKLLIIGAALLMLVYYAGAVEYPLNEYGPAGTPLDSLVIVTKFGGVYDTIDVWYNITALDTTISLAGEGLYKFEYHYYYDGYDVAVNDPDDYNTIGAYSGGPDIDTIYAYDTINTVMVSDVNIIVRNLAGSVIWQDYTGSGGYVLFPTTATDTFLISGKKFTYGWLVNDTIIVTGDQRDTLRGAPIVFDTATIANTCVVNVYVIGADGNPAEKVKVTARMHGSNLTVADSAFAVRNTAQYERTDATGKASFTCIQSRYLRPYKITSSTDTAFVQWRFQVHSPAVGGGRQDVTVPDSVSHTVKF